MRDDTPIDSDHGADWLHTEIPVLQSVTEANPLGQHESGDEWGWLDHPGETQAPDPQARRHTLSRRAVAITLAAASVAATVTGMGIIAVTHRSHTEPTIPTLTAAPPTTTSVATNDVCAGLTGHLVTDGPGDTQSMPGVIAAFEHAYYQRRDAEATLRLAAPEAGLVTPTLADGIASIPPGTTHCVAITPIAATAAEVHLVERHRDGSRIDYLQLINTRLSPTGDVLITNIQKRA